MWNVEEIEPPHRRGWLRWVIVALVILVIVAVGVWVVNPMGTQAAAPVTATASTGTIVSAVDVSGAIAAGSVDELSFGASGTVQTVKVSVGQTVSAGEVLATIDTTAADAQLNVAKANLTAAQARLTADQQAPTAATVASARDSVNQAKQQLTSAEQNLSDTKAQNTQSIDAADQSVSEAEAKLSADESANPAVPASQISADQTAVTQAKQNLSAAQVRATTSLHQAEQQLSSAQLGVTNAQDQYNLKVAPTPDAQIASDEASVAQAQQSLITAQQTSGGSEIVATNAGTVTAVSIAVGDKVGGSSGGSGSSSSSSATGQIEVMDLSHLIVTGEVSDVDVAKLKLQQPATISATALGTTTLTGTVCEIDQVGTQIQGVTSYGVQVCLDGTAPALRVGMSADAQVVVQRASGVVMVPSLAVQTRNGQQVVEVLSADGKTTTAQAVQTGLTDGQNTQIVSGLSSGTKVVLSLPSTTGTNGGSPTRGGGNFRIFGGGLGG
jgi:multidrug efflux pump subunit AcrA (membrane-fusion protein)